ncbi:sensor histidine kinase YvfT [Sporosarcina sp. NCCP-2222]|uniref:sensor histidine kinase n=1 Tax=Sporosarcina sp. NCCP-2222 TaxID=2935073 RepID=UPI002082AA77|nr:sensor histidine kinase [Sporosarcina sp. NCCP-2222]GKV57187.1 sensor histidine kinase YvfT [Sporosarcina sp. NCCP-2222]
MKSFELFPKRFGVTPYIFLVYLFMPLFHVIHSEKQSMAVMGYGLLLLFLVTYWAIYNSKLDTNNGWWLTIQMAVIVIFTVFYSPYNLLLGFFTSNFIGWFAGEKHFKWAVNLFIAILVLCLGWIYIQNGLSIVLFLLPFLVVMIMSPFGIRHMNERMDLEQRLDVANEQIKTLIKQEERVRIARDLHDTLGHTLSLITLQSQVIQRVASYPDKVGVAALEIETASRSALSQVRELVSDMRYRTIEEELAHADQILTAGGVKLQVHMAGGLSELSPLQHHIVGLCLREASTNIVKHSNAANCTVQIDMGQGVSTMRICDDGRGMAPAKRGNGLRGMEERLALIEGNLAIESGNGTCLLIAIPLVVKSEEVIV